VRSKPAVYSLVFMMAVYANAQPKPSATLIVTNAAVYTVDKQHPIAEAVAVIGDRIVAAGPREGAKRIAAQTKKTLKGEWILGARWDETKWPKPELPTKELVDEVTGATPIFVERY